MVRFMTHAIMVSGVAALALLGGCAEDPVRNEEPLIPEKAAGIWEVTSKTVQVGNESPQKIEKPAVLQISDESVFEITDEGDCYKSTGIPANLVEITVSGETISMTVTKDLSGGVAIGGTANETTTYSGKLIAGNSLPDYIPEESCPRPVIEEPDCPEGLPCNS